ncbi:hypothetical protein M501DRAFT_993471 [Patellaria atrata CBS 101060]|uniref:F-box domain-containing protein n=1 Tax=Patellaria atrata CBS 101060 TaxID=1346257 RepID=A0A9P4SI73_9PEZI|nr:hypothetical protein M501DRAFT_993471 [Patellaria atrata CBS 101060]
MASHFRFLDLPAEIRIKIYHEVLDLANPSNKSFSHQRRRKVSTFTSAIQHIHRPGTGPFENYPDYIYNVHTALLYTNRQIHHEAANVFYSANLFIRVVGCNLYQHNESELFGRVKFPNLAIRRPLTILNCSRHALDVQLVKARLPNVRQEFMMISIHELPQLVAFLANRGRDKFFSDTELYLAARRPCHEKLVTFNRLFDPWQRLMNVGYLYILGFRRDQSFPYAYIHKLTKTVTRRGFNTAAWMDELWHRLIHLPVCRTAQRHPHEFTEIFWELSMPLRQHYTTILTRPHLDDVAKRLNRVIFLAYRSRLLNLLFSSRNATVAHLVQGVIDAFTNSGSLRTFPNLLIAIPTDPKYPPNYEIAALYFVKAKALRALNKLDEALLAYEKAREFGPEGDRNMRVVDEAMSTLRAELVKRDRERCTDEDV